MFNAALIDTNYIHWTSRKCHCA